MPRNECAHATDSGHLVVPMSTIEWTLRLPTIPGNLRLNSWYYYKSGSYVGCGPAGCHRDLPGFTPLQPLVTRLAGKPFAQRYTLS